MIIWEQAPNGYIDCIVNDFYGVVGLVHPRTGWSARLDSPCGRTTAPMLFHTAAEAKLWVEGQIAEGCSGVGAPAPAYRTGSVPACWNPLARVMARSTTQLVPLAKIARAARRAVITYQHWNALYLDPRQYGRLPLCYATAQQALSRASQPT